MAQENKLVLVAVGSDRLGLVEKISEFISRRGANIEDSRMAVFEDQFALIARISGKPDELMEIARSYDELSTATGLNIWVKRGASSNPPPAVNYRLTASCLDHPGIVYAISSILSRSGINIEELKTSAYQAPESGAPMFRLEALLAVPPAIRVEQLQRHLAEVEQERSIDVTLTEIDQPVAVG